MVAKHVSDVVGRDHQGIPSLVDVLCTLAAHWALCVCAKEIRQSGLKGWAKKGLGLGEKINLLNAQIPVIESPSRKAAMQADLEELEAQSKALNEEWGQAYDEADACCELFWNAREFCTRACGIGDNELFNATLVGFDPTLLQPEQGPSEVRMSKIALLLNNLPRDEWKTQPWANPTKPTMTAAKRVAPNKLNSFIVRNLKSKAGTPKHVGTVSGQPGQPKIIPITDPEIQAVFEAVQKADPETLNLSEICREVERTQPGSKAQSIRRKWNRWKKKHG